MAIVATTPERVRTQLVKTDKTGDVLLAQMIAGVSKEIEHFLGYDFEQAQRTEEYTLDLHQRDVFLRVLPVVTLDEVRWDPLHLWPTDTIVDATNYHTDLASGILRLSATYNPRYKALQVKYTAGLATTTFGIPDAAPDIAYACDLQVSEDWRRKDSMGVSRRGGSGGGKSFQGEHRFLPRVIDLLTPRRRLVAGSDG